VSDKAGNVTIYDITVYYDIDAPTFERNGGDNIMGGSNKIDGIYYAKSSTYFRFDFEDNMKLAFYLSQFHAKYYWCTSGTTMSGCSEYSGGTLYGDTYYALDIKTPSLEGDWYLWTYMADLALTDMAGNYVASDGLDIDKPAIILHFVIDDTAPVITITDLEVGNAYVSNTEKYYTQPGKEVKLL
jgi:hypothetical protein